MTGVIRFTQGRSPGDFTRVGKVETYCRPGLAATARQLHQRGQSGRLLLGGGIDAAGREAAAALTGAAKLDEAVRVENIQPYGQSHRSLADCVHTARLVLKIATKYNLTKVAQEITKSGDGV